MGLTLFPGGNTPAGFYDCFDSALRGCERRFILKGGPGVGKSTLMRRVARALEAAGRRVDCYPCASDPDSLDIVAAPETAVALLDGTAPHVFDPQVPGARDTLVNLGECLDEKRLRARADEIERAMRAVSASFRAARDWLSAAAQARRAACAPLAPRAAREARELARAYIPDGTGAENARTLFGEAYTPKGFVSLVADLPRRAAIPLDAARGEAADGVLRALAREAECAGQAAILLLDPLEPARAAQLYLPDAGALFLSGDAIWADGAARRLFDELTGRALSCLRSAKAAHDGLEKHYRESMDYAKWDAWLARILDEII